MKKLVRFLLFSILLLLSFNTKASAESLSLQDNSITHAGHNWMTKDSKGGRLAQGPRLQDNLITWAGHDWIIKDSKGGRLAPGNNVWNPKNVYIDSNGNLRLKVDYNSALGVWECAQLSMNKSLGYGTYRFYVYGALDALDPNVVLGLYQYDQNSPDAAAANYREIDIEFSMWGHDPVVYPNYVNSQYVIQPYNTPGQQFRFDTVLSNGQSSTHEYKWTPEGIHFKSSYGFYADPPPSYIYQEWDYTGNNVPTDGLETIRMNLWLYNADKPMYGKKQEIIITGFEYIPL
ncbi:glycoside hydrolase family 16 protein [Metabacillus sp. RGM 3146]|uniref:glycoside hydrolase family 16 protein n=1 Tax=Metabacillus sp. RGM 3146 TaxID=3401092 RepID=UPI003B9C6B1F